MAADNTRVLVVHRNHAFAERLKRQLDGYERLAPEFAHEADGLSGPSISAQPDAIVLDLAALAPRGFALHRILEARSRAMSPVAIYRARRERRTRQRRREPWRASEGMEALEAGLQVVLGRIPHQFSWLPVTFSGTHLTADLPNTYVSVDGQPVAISAREGEVLALLLTHCNRLVRRELLLSEIWGYETRSLDVHVRRLRQKLGAARSQLETVTAFGYRFVDPSTVRGRGIARQREIYASETHP
jgi:DNA-binding response OmpR family regulator